MCYVPIREWPCIGAILCRRSLYPVGPHRGAVANLGTRFNSFFPAGKRRITVKLDFRVPFGIRDYGVPLN